MRRQRYTIKKALTYQMIKDKIVLLKAGIMAKTVHQVRFRSGISLLLFLPLLLLLLSISVVNCQKNPITPGADSLTRPVIWLNTFEFSFFASEIGPNPFSQELLVKNSGQHSLTYELSDDADWINIDPPNGTSSGQINGHAVVINKGGLSARDENYSATITVTSSDAYNNPQKVTVSLKITKEPPPEILVNPPDLSFVAQVNGSNPPSKNITLKNGGSGILNYSISDDADWLEVSPTSGSSSGENRAHSVSVKIGGLGQGVYSGTITIHSSNAINSPQQVSVTLRIGSIPTNNEIRVSCSPSSATANATINVPISILGNINEISSFGLQLNFDTNMFQYVGTKKGSLTGGWAYVDGNNVAGTVTLGGFAGSASPIAVGSTGSIAIVTLKVTGGSYPNGQQSQITISNYNDDIAGMNPEPASTTFTLKK